MGEHASKMNDDPPQDRSRLEVDDLPHIAWLSTADGAALYLNRFGREFLGLPPSGSDDGAEAWLSRVHPADETRVRQAWRRTRGEAYAIEYRLRTAAGDYRWVLERSQPRRNADGEAFPWVGACSLIDDAKRDEPPGEARGNERAGEERLRRFFDLGLVGMAVLSPTRSFLEVNDQLCALLGYERDELLRRPWAELVQPDDPEADAARFEALLAGDSDRYAAQTRWVRKDGQVVHVALAVNGLRRSDGSADCLLALFQDVSEHRRSDEQQARLSQAVEQTMESIVITDPQGTILYVNPAFESVTGYGRAEVLGGNPRILKSGYQDAVYYRRMWQTIAGGGVWQGRLVNRRKDGTLFEEDATIGPVRDASGRIVNYVAVKRDVTNETRLERQLMQAQRLEAVGRLAGGVAHDFNNLLGVIMGYAEITRRRLPPGDPLQEKLDEILKAAERATSLTRQLLAFSRQQVLQPRVLDLNAVVSDMEKMLRRLIGEDIALSTALEPGIGNIKADPGQIEQVIMNLAVNARDAMPRGGRLAIETHAAEFDADFVARHPLAKPGRYVLLAVSDTGAGMDAETQAHAF
jgi:PAS domain S-box-containing protein